MHQAATSAVQWLARRPGWMFLTAPDDRLAREDPQRFRHAGWELLAISLAWGAASVGIWAAAWGVFGGGGWLLLPAGSVVAVMLLGPLRRAAIALSQIVGGTAPAGQGLAAAVLAISFTLALVAMKSGLMLWSPTDVPQALGWFFPDYKPYRVLVLMPLWGGWSMLILGHFRRPGQAAEPAVGAFVAGCGPAAATAVMGVLLAATVLEFRFLPWTQLSIGACAIGAAVVAGLLLCRACGGLCRRALLATNLLTQLAFLLAYLANSK